MLVGPRRNEKSDFLPAPVIMSDMSLLDLDPRSLVVLHLIGTADVFTG
jgi:hypothetical protein